MKTIIEYTEHNRVYSYYLCETEEEYALKRQSFPNRPEINIDCRPYHIVSDGVCSYGGKHFDAVGISLHNHHFSAYYIKPGTIANEKEVKSQNWWV